MKRPTAFVLSFLTVALILLVPAYANGADFCTSKGYVAYDLGEEVTPGVFRHVLRVARFGSPRGIYVVGEVKLLDFNVYHLICSEDHIEISGWRNVITKYVIYILPSGELKTVGPTEYPDLNWKVAAEDGPPPQSLAIFIPNGDPISVDSPDPEHTYQILRSWTWTHEQSKKGWDENHIKSELVQLDKGGNVSQRLVLYERRYMEPQSLD